MKLRIDRITLREIRLPLKEPFQISSGTIENRRICVLELQSAEGTVGWSECVAGEFPNYHPETIDTVWLALREWIIPRILGVEFSGPQEIYDLLNRDIRGHQMARAAVEMGAWELAAHMKGDSLAKLLGGVREKIEVGISLGITKNPEALVEKVQQSFKQGYRKIKVKIKPGKDVEYVKSVRSAVGMDVPIMVDANNAYSLNDIDRLKELDDFNLMMIEQPLAWDDLVRHAKLQKLLKTPICLDESITGVDKAEDMITLGSGKIINIKPGRVGGFLQAIAIHNLCADHGIPVWCGGMLESGIGRAHNVALASLPNFTLPGDLSPSARYWERDIVSPEWTMDADGMVTVPREKPGMGIDVDMNRVENLTVRSETLKAR
ncbi:MAG: o-succinylbenzoate synthase [Bacteroidota bacterium]